MRIFRLFWMPLMTVMLLGLTGCISMPVPWFRTEAYGVDYFKAGLKGKVFITESNSVNFEYLPIGSITVEQTSGYLDAGKSSDGVVEKVEKTDPIYGSSDKVTKKVIPAKRKKGEYKHASYESVLEEASMIALKMGGDAIINLKLDRVIDYYDNKPTGAHPAITGMVVKRK